MPFAYYNEIDPDAVAVLRELIASDVIAPGDVDDRSIKDVTADDLRGYAQCHFFAGGGLWSVAARMAGWPDERPLWTGSCPCQPFSVAGQRAGTDDPRHLWPDLHRLIRAGRPPIVMGEQVAGKAGRNWFNGVRADLAGGGYAGRAVDIPACAVDAPHERNRLFWIAMADAERSEWRQATPAGARSAREKGKRNEGSNRFGGRDEDRVLVHAESVGRREGRSEHEFRSGWPAAASADGASDAVNSDDVGQPEARTERAGLQTRWHSPPGPAASSELGDPCGAGLPAPERAAVLGSGRRSEGRATEQSDGALPRRNGSWWADAEWIACHDGKARRTQPGTPLLVDGLPGRVGLWRVAGNAISPVLAAEVIGAFLDTEGRP